MGKAQRLLSNAGTFDLAIPRERSGTPSDALFDGIAAFQAQAGLPPDGVMRPGGPTVTALDRGLGVGALTRTAQQLPDDGFRPLPPEDGGQQLPPDDGFRPQPPTQGGVQQPPDDGFRPRPPAESIRPIPGGKTPQRPPDDGFRPRPGEDNDPDAEEGEADQKPDGETCERIRAEIERAKADVEASTADVERDQREIGEIENRVQQMKAESERLLREIGAKSLLDALRRNVPFIRILEFIINIGNVVLSLTLEGRARQLKEILEFINEELRKNIRNLEMAQARIKELIPPDE